MDSANKVTDTLLAIRRLGVNLSLDDFGTGYSSLSYLGRFPLDELKIDRSFVTASSEPASAVDGGRAAVITRAIIATARGLGLRVVAEGVETRAQLNFARAHACHEYQGFLFSRPLPAAGFEALLAAQHSAPTPAARDAIAA